MTCQGLAIWNVIQYYTHRFSVYCVCKNLPQPCLLARALMTPALLAALRCLLIYLSSLPPELNPSSIRSVGNVPSVPFPSGPQFFPWLMSRILHEHCPFLTGEVDFLGGEASASTRPGRVNSRTGFPWKCQTISFSNIRSQCTYRTQETYLFSCHKNR